MHPEDDPPTAELRADQLKREIAERERAARSDDPDDTYTHERRADKARYLREKLEQRERSEREARAAERGPAGEEGHPRDGHREPSDGDRGRGDPDRGGAPDDR